MLTIPIALIQFDAIPEQIDTNLAKMESLAKQAATSGARWIMFHEGTTCDYTPNVPDFSETVPEGKCTQKMIKLSKELNCFIH